MCARFLPPCPALDTMQIRARPYMPSRQLVRVSQPFYSAIERHIGRSHPQPAIVGLWAGAGAARHGAAGAAGALLLHCQRGGDDGQAAGACPARRVRSLPRTVAIAGRRTRRRSRSHAPAGWRPAAQPARWRGAAAPALLRAHLFWVCGVAPALRSAQVLNGLELQAGAADEYRQAGLGNFCFPVRRRTRPHPPPAPPARAANARSRSCRDARCCPSARAAAHGGPHAPRAHGPRHAPALAAPSCRLRPHSCGHAPCFARPKAASPAPC